MRRLSRWLLVMTLSLSIGLQWVVVQGAAWVGMIVSYSQQSSFSRSLKMTFDGRHPCNFCRAAQKGESTQTKRDADESRGKLVLAAPEAESFVFSTEAADCHPAPVIPAVRRSQRPPAPPPRFV
jgi:hypothetical protein